jgi:hypothetical protein
MTFTVHRFDSSHANPEKKAAMEVAEQMAGHYVKVKAVDRMLRMAIETRNKQTEESIVDSHKGCYT